MMKKAQTKPKFTREFLLRSLAEDDESSEEVHVITVKSSKKDKGSMDDYKPAKEFTHKPTKRKRSKKKKSKSVSFQSAVSEFSASIKKSNPTTLVKIFSLAAETMSIAKPPTAYKALFHPSLPDACNMSIPTEWPLNAVPKSQRRHMKEVTRSDSDEAKQALEHILPRFFERRADHAFPERILLQLLVPLHHQMAYGLIKTRLELLMPRIHKPATPRVVLDALWLARHLPRVEGVKLVRIVLHRLAADTAEVKPYQIALLRQCVLFCSLNADREVWDISGTLHQALPEQDADWLRTKLARMATRMEGAEGWAAYLLTRTEHHHVTLVLCDALLTRLNTHREFAKPLAKLMHGDSSLTLMLLETLVKQRTHANRSGALSAFRARGSKLMTAALEAGRLEQVEDSTIDKLYELGVTLPRDTIKRSGTSTGSCILSCCGFLIGAGITAYSMVEVELVHGLVSWMSESMKSLTPQ
eukprot:gnl/Dysnectes_brevis/628_a695_1722.p1 GENE.gnl/Dysnectes_brevis/628_a695_1722~~gnl/Dysnectes_brevis/628_a695_1722.p1  ORF type:complete len:471 (+),score=134.38 gnl/Dysnectes_brevis/628_a695_1722:1143-2555(+)